MIGVIAVQQDKQKNRRWSKAEDKKLIRLVNEYFVIKAPTTTYDKPRRRVVRSTLCQSKIVTKKVKWVKISKVLSRSARACRHRWDKLKLDTILVKQYLLPEEATATGNEHDRPVVSSTVYRANIAYKRIESLKVREGIDSMNCKNCRDRQVKHLNPTFNKNKQKRKRWSKAEDARLTELVNQYLVTNPVTTIDNDYDRPVVGSNLGGPNIFSRRIKWSKISDEVGGRSGKQCRDRWINYLDPNLVQSVWTEEEDTKLLHLASSHAKQWAFISRALPGRSQNQIKARLHQLKRIFHLEVEQQNVMMPFLEDNQSLCEMLDYEASLALDYRLEASRSVSPISMDTLINLNTFTEAFERDCQ